MTNDAANLPAQGAILLVDKAEGWTSHDVVAKSRRAFGTRKVGHAGTLDPMATGLLVLGAGPSTRLLTHLVGLDKTYLATIRLGYATLTDDREGERISTADASAMSAVTPERVAAAAAELTGSISQAPSAVSAIKVNGQRAYDRVRAGETVELQQRPVTVYAFELGEARNGFDETGGPVIDIDATVRCSTGTYIRALARDLGNALGVGGHLTMLRRTRVGPFDVADAVSTDALARGGALPILAPTSVATTLFPRLDLSSEQAVDLGNGKKLEVDAAATADAAIVAAVGPGERLVGLVQVKRGRVRAVTNFPVEPGGAA